MKLNASMMVSNFEDLNKTVEKVKTNFNVSSDENVKKVQNTKDFVAKLKALEDPKLMKELTVVITKIKNDSNDASKHDIKLHLKDIKSLFFANAKDPKKEQKIECL